MTELNKPKPLISQEALEFFGFTEAELESSIRDNLHTRFRRRSAEEIAQCRQNMSPTMSRPSPYIK